VPVGLIVWWWFASADSSNVFFPPLSEIITKFRENWLSSGFVENALPSIRNFALSLAIAVVVGIVVGLVIGRIWWLRRAVNPLITFFRSVPGVAFIPLLIAFVGFTSGMRISVILLAAVFPTLIATTDGVLGVNNTLREVSASYRISKWREIGSIYLPAAGPQIFAGIEISVSLAFTVMIASEFQGISTGIGAQMVLAQQALLFADMWAAIVLLALLGIASKVLFTAVQRSTLRWYFAQRV
jgi:ABC-type nitrate/sulfonate/bicarbonate transport system permease component